MLLQTVIEVFKIKFCFQSSLKSATDCCQTFYSNYGSISRRFRDIQCRKLSRPWNSGQGSIKVIGSGAIR